MCVSSRPVTSFAPRPLNSDRESSRFAGLPKLTTFCPSNSVCRPNPKNHTPGTVFRPPDRSLGVGFSFPSPQSRLSRRSATLFLTFHSAIAKVPCLTTTASLLPRRPPAFPLRPFVLNNNIVVSPGGKCHFRRENKDSVTPNEGTLN